MTEDKLIPSMQAAIRRATSMAQAENHTTYGIPHLILTFFSENSAGLTDILASMNKDVEYIIEWFEMRKEMYISEEEVEGNVIGDSQIRLVLDEAERSKIILGLDDIDALCVFTAAIRKGVIFSDAQLNTIGVTENEILSFFNAQEISNAYQGEENKLLATIPYACNLKSEEYIARGGIVLGREKEVRTILECLERSSSKGVMLSGNLGVGKTSVIHAFVKSVCENNDEMVSQKTIIALQPNKLLASVSSETELSKKISDFLDKLDKLEGDTVLVVDGLQVLLDFSNGSQSATLLNILNSQISKGTTSLLFALTPDAYRKYVEKHAIMGNVELVEVSEADRLTSLSILRKHADSMEKHYGISISDDAVSEAFALSTRYLKGKSQPAASIDLLDATTASVRLSNKNAVEDIKSFMGQIESKNSDEPRLEINDIYLLGRSISSKLSVVLTSKLSMDISSASGKSAEKSLDEFSEALNFLLAFAENGINQVTQSEVEAVVADLTGIPLGKIQAEEKDRLMGIDKRLEERVKGQRKAIATLSDAIIESRSGLSDPNKPIGSFFFLGPTGTGKTELAKSLAELLFDDENAMIRFDMSEFKEEHSAALLYGAPPGYVGYEEGGLLVTKIRQKPYSVILFDEIEKAHHSVYDVFLQIMDEGKLHDKLGREGDFSNAIVIFTSNLASNWIAEQFRAGKEIDSKNLIEVMSANFRPEFLGRLTEIVPFSPINEDIAKSIFKLQFSRLQRQLEQQKNIRLEISDGALNVLTAKGYSEQYGARPIAGVIRTYIKKNISKQIVAEHIKDGDKILLDFQNNELLWRLI